MKAQLKVRKNLILELEEDKQSDLFRSLASAQEVFGEECCGKCQNTELVFRTRKNADEDEFFELLCPKCFAVLAISQNKKGGTLYPNRQGKDEAGEKIQLKCHGWRKWNKEKKCLE